MSVKKGPKWKSRKWKSRRTHDDPEALFRRQAEKMAKDALENAVQWIGKNDVGWALVEAQRAIKLLEVAR